jgi:hypothetical protein
VRCRIPRLNPKLKCGKKNYQEMPKREMPDLSTLLRRRCGVSKHLLIKFVFTITFILAEQTVTRLSLSFHFHVTEQDVLNV